VRFLEGRITFVHVSHDDGKSTILPVLGLRVDETVKLIGSHSFGINDLSNSVHVSEDVISTSKSLPDGSLTGSWVTNDEDGVSNTKDLMELDTFGYKTEFSLNLDLEVLGLTSLNEFDLELRGCERKGLQVCEESINQTTENGPIVGNNLGVVEIFQTSHENKSLGIIRGSSLKTTSLSQHRLYCSKTPIIMDLLREEGFGKIIQTHEFLGEILGLSETFRHEHILANKGNIWDNHCTGSEKSLKILGKLSSTSVTGVHGNEETDGRSEVKLVLKELEYSLS
jgi:hypothetical protein